MVTLTYCGGIPELTKVGDYKVAAGPVFFQIKNGLMKFLEIPYDKIFDVSMKTEEQLVNSAAPLDFLFAGKMAFALKKKEVTNYLVIDYECGGGIKTSAFFKGENVPLVHSVMLQKRVEYANSRPALAPSESAPAAGPSDDVAADIQKFYDLKEKGIITEEEFAAKKSQLLGV